jgi:GNAT superfamily N-acetyltransferase
MTSSIEIREMITAEEMHSCYPLLLQLKPDLKKEEYERMIAEMRIHGYRQVAAFESGKCIGLSGFWINTKIYCGKYIEPDNVVIDSSSRSKGVGKLLCDWIMDEGKKQGCVTAVLDAFVENSGAHRFYFREGFVVRGFHFLKKL